MVERERVTLAYRQLQASVHYCLPRTDKPLEGEEALHATDENLRVWIDDDNKQKLNATMFLQNGVVEVRFFGPDQSLNECFFAACVKLGLAARYAIGRRSKTVATSVLFKLRDDEAKRLDDEYSDFRPKPFTLDDARRGVIVNYAPAAKKGSNAHLVTALMPGSLLWHENGVDYDLLVWRSETGLGAPKAWQTSLQPVEYFRIVRAAAYAAILNIVTVKAWSSYPERRSFSEFLARIVRDGEATNSNVVFAKASRAIIADPAQAEALIELIAESKTLPETRKESLDLFRMARERLKKDPTTTTVAGWSIIKERFGEDAHKALRTVLNVGADSTLLEDFADRYLFHSGRSQFIDRQAFREGQAQFIFTKDELTLRHAPDQIQTKKKPVKAFPIFTESKLRQEVTGIELHPDQIPGSVLRVTRQSAIVADDDYAPEHSRLIFNSWAGLYIKPAKTIDAELKVECEKRLDQMLGWVARTPERIAWVKAHFGWTLKHPGQKQQVALVCTGGQGTGKTFLCKDFANAVFDKYASVASVRALEEPFYIPGYVDKLWVNHDEVVTKSDTIEIIKDLIRSTRISGQFKGQNVAVHPVYARLAFTSNETNPGLSRGERDRGLFQVTSISPTTMNMLPGEFERWTGKNLKPFYADFAAFLQRDEVRQTYVKLLMDCAPDTVAEVENVEYSAMHDGEVIGEQLTPAQQIAREIIEEGTIWGGFDIAMPFRQGHLQNCVRRAAKNMGMHGFVSIEAILNLFFDAQILCRPTNGAPFLFDYKVGGLVRLFGEFIGVPLHFRWPLEPNDDMPNDWREGDAMEPWKGRGK